MCEWAVFCAVFFPARQWLVGNIKKKNQKIGRKRLFLRIISVLNKAYIRKPWARFSKVPKSSRIRKAVAKSHIFGLQSCFIHIFLNMNRDSFHTIRFSVIHFSAFKCQLPKNGFSGPENIWGFRETDARPQDPSPLILPWVNKQLQWCLWLRFRTLGGRVGWRKDSVWTI